MIMAPWMGMVAVGQNDLDRPQSYVKGNIHGNW